ncbi:MAG: Gfo/Idh/MocA family oxidoreductase [Anaerolineae bacterium]|nr:Gfo/Idh/MocA family oxidoreductase [Anaerolineae bacterium]
MTKYRAAIVGLTGIGAGRSALAPSPALGPLMPHSHAGGYAHNGVEVVAVCDLRPELIEDFRRRWGDVWPDVRGYSDYRRLLADEHIDLLSVATPDHRHAQIVVDATEAGVRGIFCEKPIATTIADADRMIAACADRGIPLQVDHTRRWYPDYVTAKRIMQSGEIGPLCRIVATLSGPRAMLFRNGTHLVDAVCYFADADPISVAGLLDDEHADYGPRYQGDGGHDPAEDPGGSALVCFANGVRAFINASKRTMRHFELELWAEHGRIRLGADSSDIARLEPGDRHSITPLPRNYSTRSDLAAAVAELIGLVENGSVGTSTGEDGRRTLSIILGLLQSNAAGGTPIRFPIADA